MYPHFIEVHDIEEGYPILMNIDSIANAITVKYECGTGTAINCRDCGGQVTKESYDEVKKLIEDVGALIIKGDTRIDTQHRLTMQDLQGMVGEPVWNSNTNTWLLVYDGDWGYGPDPDRVCVRVVNRYGCKDIWLSEEDLIAKPLYRMKAG